MTIDLSYDKQKIKDIVKDCGSSNVKNTYSYLDVISFHSKEKFKCVIIDDNCFVAGTIGKNHFRIIEMAVRQTAQKGGYGSLLISYLKTFCKSKGLKKLTFRTSKNETAVNFFKKKGGIIVGEKGEDYEMEIYV